MSGKPLYSQHQAFHSNPVIVCLFAKKKKKKKKIRQNVMNTVFFPGVVGRPFGFFSGSYQKEKSVQD